MFPRKEGKYDPYFPGEEKKKAHIIWTTSCVWKWKQGKTTFISLNLSKDNHIWFELLDASENERREIRSLFPQYKKIKETIDILFELLHVSGKKENKILVSPTSQEQTYCLCVWQLLHAFHLNPFRSFSNLQMPLQGSWSGSIDIRRPSEALWWSTAKRFSGGRSAETVGQVGKSLSVAVGWNRVAVVGSRW
jgi:hypothetical protein